MVTLKNLLTTRSEVKVEIEVEGAATVFHWYFPTQKSEVEQDKRETRKTLQRLLALLAAKSQALAVGSELAINRQFDFAPVAAVPEGLLAQVEQLVGDSELMTAGVLEVLPNPVVMLRDSSTYSYLPVLLAPIC